MKFCSKCGFIEYTPATQIYSETITGLISIEGWGPQHSLENSSGTKPDARPDSGQDDRKRREHSSSNRYQSNYLPKANTELRSARESIRLRVDKRENEIVTCTALIEKRAKPNHTPSRQPSEK
ncbi:unnamed protein product [Ceratitis capitata]|uniref:(Mediterranean fruit fly) hypothetical protein n=1 Tax=Ceratitis capitata TaxID=7213 RepID=A0A811UWB8_CERCA|nr:unnamed protein product [Ceratitis capitata]